MKKAHIWPALCLALMPFLPAQANEALLRHNCGACHADPANPEAPLSRISEQRKSPEGWEMTLHRMQTIHGVQLSDPDGKSDSAGVLFQLLKYLSDTHGLAPAETVGLRYTLERRHNTVDIPEDAEYAVMCTRCHSNARVALQRRTEPEWRNLIHFHLAQHAWHLHRSIQNFGKHSCWSRTTTYRIYIFHRRSLQDSLDFQ